MRRERGARLWAKCAASVVGSATALLAALLASPAAAQLCIGDCNGNQTVTVEELVRAVNLALGSQTAGSCSGLDASGDGAVTIDELVAAVDNAVHGCPSSIRSTARAAARVAITSVTSLSEFGRVDLRMPQAISAAVSGGAGALGTETAGGARQSGCDTRDCPLGGTVKVCCFEGEEFSIDQTGCAFRDGSGNRVEQSGFRRLNSADPDVCSGQIPTGSTFFLEATNFVESSEDSLGNVSVLVADFREGFDPATAGCALAEPDPLGFAIRGEGTREIDGSVRRRVRGASGDVSEDIAVTARGLIADIALSPGELSGCEVDVDLDGDMDVADFVSGEHLSQTLDLFGLTEIPRSHDLLLEYDGSIATDCLGDINLATDLDFPIRFVPFEACPVGGVLEADLENGSTIRILYTGAGGVRLDYGADDTVEEQLPSCAGLARRECPLAEAEGQCTPCASFGDCPGTLVCTPCVTCETEQSRCVPFAGIVFCGDDLYADFETP